ncbi:MAG: hypothetical protein WA957_02080 [Alteraurantiacibacter sp.]
MAYSPISRHPELVARAGVSGPQNLCGILQEGAEPIVWDND